MRLYLISMEKIKRMQDNLLLIRRIVGWSAEEFGEKIGVTRQTINSIESGRYKLTKTQYLAIRYVLNEEIIRNVEETRMLSDIIKIFIDDPDNYTENQRKELKSKANLIAPSVLAKTATKKELSNEWISLIAATGIAVGTTVASTLLGGKTLTTKQIKSLMNEVRK